MKSAALCEINNCGVLAVGRCHKCSRAFCKSHGGFESEGKAYSNQCLICTREIKQGWEEQYNLAHADEIYINSAARDKLRKHKVPTIEIYTFKFVGPKNKRNIFGQIEDGKPNLLGNGWLLGDFFWKYSSSDDLLFKENTTGNYPTVLMDSDHRTNTAEINRVSINSNLGIYVVNDNSSLEFGDEWSSLAAAVKQLLR